MQCNTVVKTRLQNLIVRSKWFKKGTQCRTYVCTDMKKVKIDVNHNSEQKGGAVPRADWHKTVDFLALA